MDGDPGEARLVLVRHGETEWNREGRIQGYHADSPLTANGHAQAKALAARLAREGIDAIFASDTGRTRLTAHPIGLATGLEVIHDCDLRERSYGVFEGRTFAEIERDHPEDYQRIRSRDPHYAAPGGENAMQFERRIIGALNRIALQCTGKRALVVTHQGVLGVLYRHVHGLPVNEPKRPPLLNASCNHFRFSRGRWIMDAWCDIDHLPAEKRDAN
jgi:2,3-bisphosphoglycerate-dependent phosphoglycerate mutase